jgi:hypothetical protein
MAGLTHLRCTSPYALRVLSAHAIAAMNASHASPKLSLPPGRRDVGPSLGPLPARQLGLGILGLAQASPVPDALLIVHVIAEGLFLLLAVDGVAERSRVRAPVRRGARVLAGLRGARLV